jgi:hypothetical protein
MTDNLYFSDDDQGGFVDAPDDAPEYVTDSAKGAVIIDNDIQTSGPTSYTGERTAPPPKDEIENNRTLYNTSPHVGHAVDVILDWLLADGWNLTAPNMRGVDTRVDDEDVTATRRLMRNSDFTRKFNDWIENAAVEGHAFMELVVQDGTFSPRVLPYKRMHKYTDVYGQVEKYILEPADGGPDAEDAAVYNPHEIAEFTFRQDPLEQLGRSLIGRVNEQADMLRDMEIDYARFVASKAYPPILWKLGTADEQWSEAQIANWLDEVEKVEPDSSLAAPHDVEAEVVGTTSTSSSAGAMRLEDTFRHHERRIVTGIGIPAVLANMDNKGASAEAVMPAFKRRIRRLQTMIADAVEQQIIKPLFVQSVNGQEDLAEYDGLIPEFEFGEYSSDEKRLEVDKLIKLFNNGMLNREAFAKRAGIDPDIELPTGEELTDEVIPIIRELAGQGDRVQNPEGGRPTDTGGGAQSAGREVTSREEGSDDNSGDADRPEQAAGEAR